MLRLLGRAAAPGSLPGCWLAMAWRLPSSAGSAARCRPKSRSPVNGVSTAHSQFSVLRRAEQNWGTQQYSNRSEASFSAADAAQLSGIVLRMSNGASSGLLRLATSDPLSSQVGQGNALEAAALLPSEIFGESHKTSSNAALCHLQAPSASSFPCLPEPGVARRTPRAATPPCFLQERGSRHQFCCSKMHSIARKSKF